MTWKVYYKTESFEIKEQGVFLRALNDGGVRFTLSQGSHRVFEKLLGRVLSCFRTVFYANLGSSQTN